MKPALILFLLAPLCWAAEEAPKHPPAIQAIVEKAEADVSKNRKVYDAANSKALDAAEKALKAELEKMTKAGKLEEAMAAKKMLESVRADVVAKVDEQARDNGGLLGDDTQSNDARLTKLLLSKDWNFYHHPPAGFALMRFAAGGVFTAWKNENESSWRIQNGKLEIYHASGQVFNRYEWKDGKWGSTTNDANKIYQLYQEITPIPKTCPSREYG